MGQYRRYYYFIDTKNNWVTDYSSDRSNPNARYYDANLLYIGSYYKHEQHPYREGDCIYRDRYNKQILIAQKINGKWVRI